MSIFFNQSFTFEKASVCCVCIQRRPCILTGRLVLDWRVGNIRYMATGSGENKTLLGFCSNAVLPRKGVTFWGGDRKEEFTERLIPQYRLEPDYFLYSRLYFKRRRNFKIVGMRGSCLMNYVARDLAVSFFNGDKTHFMSNTRIRNPKKSRAKRKPIRPVALIKKKNKRFFFRYRDLRYKSVVNFGYKTLYFKSKLRDYVTGRMHKYYRPLGYGRRLRRTRRYIFYPMLLDIGVSVFWLRRCYLLRVTDTKKVRIMLFGLVFSIGSTNLLKAKHKGLPVLDENALKVSVPVKGGASFFHSLPRRPVISGAFSISLSLAKSAEKVSVWVKLGACLAIATALIGCVALADVILWCLPVDSALLDNAGWVHPVFGAVRPYSSLESLEDAIDRFKARRVKIDDAVHPVHIVYNKYTRLWYDFRALDQKRESIWLDSAAELAGLRKQEYLLYKRYREALRDYYEVTEMLSEKRNAAVRWRGWFPSGVYHDDGVLRQVIAEQRKRKQARRAKKRK